MEELKEALEKSWSKETSYLPEDWYEGNPARGQCAVTALVVQDYLGGEIIRCEVGPDSESHYFNRLDNSKSVDLTRVQFKDGATITNEKNIDRSKILSHSITNDRYSLLKEKVKNFISE